MKNKIKTSNCHGFQKVLSHCTVFGWSYNVYMYISSLYSHLLSGKSLCRCFPHRYGLSMSETMTKIYQFDRNVGTN